MYSCNKIHGCRAFIKVAFFSESFIQLIIKAKNIRIRRQKMNLVLLLVEVVVVEVHDLHGH